MRRLLLPISAAAVVLAVVVLAFKVRARPERKANDKALAQAEAQFKRGEDRVETLPALERSRAKAQLAQVPVPVPREAPPKPTETPEPAEGPLSPREPGSEPTEANQGPVPTGPEIINSGEPDVAEQMELATQMFDRGDYPGAEDVALHVLAREPDNARMTRIVVSSACATGNIERAKEYYGRLPTRDQKQMQKRCNKWGVRLGDELTP